MLTLFRLMTGRRHDERDPLVLGHPCPPAEGVQPIPGGPRGTAAVRLRDTRIHRRLHARFILGEEVRVRSRRRRSDVIPPNVVEERLHGHQNSDTLGFAEWETGSR